MRPSVEPIEVSDTINTETWRVVSLLKDRNPSSGTSCAEPKALARGRIYPIHVHNEFVDRSFSCLLSAALIHFG